MSNILYILLAVLVLGVIIVLHELGHFLVGRACGIGVVEFSVGMGPRLLKHVRGGIEYSLRLFPVGGYCKFVGEDDESDLPNAMNNAPVWKRFVTVLAGPAMNFALAWVVIVAMFLIWPQITGIYPAIESVSEGLPAIEAGLQAGDVIVAVDGVAVSYTVEGTEQIRAAIAEGESVALTVDRGGETLTFTVAPESVEQADGSASKVIGIVFASETRRDTFFEAIADGSRELVADSTMMLDVLRRLIFHGEGAENMAGAIGTVAVVSQQLKVSMSYLMDFLFIISLNLGIINLIPFPGLDGSRLLFLIIEAVRKKPVPPEKEGLVHAIGLVLLLALMVVLAVHDVRTYLL